MCQYSFVAANMSEIRKCSISKKGFSLIELMVVISIISLLVSLSLLSLDVSKKHAVDGTTVLNVREITTALYLYRQDHGKYPCHAYQTSGDPTFLAPLVQQGYLSQQVIDRLYINYDYNSQSFPGGPCGTGYMLGFTFNVPITTCPFNAHLIPDSFAGQNVHCHVFEADIGPDCNPGGANPGTWNGPGCPYGDIVSDY